MKKFIYVNTATNKKKFSIQVMKCYKVVKREGLYMSVKYIIVTKVSEKLKWHIYMNYNIHIFDIYIYECNFFN